MNGSGSSPRLRGTGAQPCVDQPHPRFIPAPAGNGHDWDIEYTVNSVHPRACGERSRPNTTVQSSPRFIPAPAGNGQARWSSRRPRPVHPRACGERIPSLSRMSPSSDSRWRRFIPAPAGNGMHYWVKQLTDTVHPRACGERDSSGSRQWRGRFIPAPAGNGPLDDNCLRSGSSPRLRGTGLIYPVMPRGGSSPRLRGTARYHEVVIKMARFIPAPAGNGVRHGRSFEPWAGSSPRLRGTAVHGQPGSSAAVHPRACGERERLDGRLQPLQRFIPAPAGNGAACLVASTSHVRFIPAPAGNGIEPDRILRAHGRFIPAPAGNGCPKSCERSSTGNPVHPRACGERSFAEDI